MVKKPEIKLNAILPAIDSKNHEYWDKLTPEEQAAFSPWLLARYVSTVTGPTEVERYYIMSTNETINKRLTGTKNHPQLQYLLMTAASPGIGNQRHNWLAPPKRGKDDKTGKILTKLFPDANDDEIELLSLINSDKEIEQHLRDAGYTDKEIKKGTISD